LLQVFIGSGGEVDLTKNYCYLQANMHIYGNIMRLECQLSKKTEKVRTDHAQDKFINSKT